MTADPKSNRRRPPWTAWADFLNISERFVAPITAGRYWEWRVTVVAVFVSLFFSFPLLTGLGEGRTWQAVLLKRNDLSRNIVRDFGPATNAARVNFRLTVPVLARALSLEARGLMAVQFCAGILILLLCCRLSDRITGSRPAALYVTLAVACLYAGATSFLETRGVFDGIGIALLMSALWFEAPFAALATFAACWNDERAIIAAPLVILCRLETKGT